MGTRRKAAAALLAAACVMTTAVVTANPAAAKLTGVEIKIGMLEAQTGAPGASGRQTLATDTMNAWVKWTNAHGGINGHPVKLIAIDSKADPAAAKAALKQLVQKDGVLALVGSNDAATQPTWGTYLKGQKTPMIGGPIYSADPFVNPYVYAATTTVVSNVWGEVYAAKKAGVKKLASLLCSNSTVCQGARPLVKAAADELGIEVVYDEVADQTATSYTPQCLSMRDSGADAVLPFVNNQLLARDCVRQGYHPTWITSNGAITMPQIRATPEFEGTVGPIPQFPWWQQFPATKSYFDAMKKYAPQYMPGGKKNDLLGLASTDAWASGEILKKAITNAGVAAKTRVTKPALMRGLSMFKGETLGGMSPPLTYSDGTKPNPQVKCFYLFKITGKKNVMTPSNKLQYFCQP